MPLQMSVDDRYVATHATAYLRVQAAIIDFEQDKITAEVLYFVNEAAYLAGAQPFNTERHVIPFDALVKNGAKAEATAQLLLLDAFSTATEVA